MKAARIAIILMAAALLVFGLSGAAFAFHNGGVGFCEGCHTMHNSVTTGTVPTMSPGMTSNSGVTGWTGTGYGAGAALNTNTAYDTAGGVAGNGENQYLLRGSDPSSPCLNCHAANSSTPLFFQEMSDGTANVGSVQNPGGDFEWVRTSYTYTLVNPDNSTSVATSHGWNHGHKIVAEDFGLGWSTGFTNLVSAPGSSVVSGGQAYPASDLACNSCHDPHGRSTVKGNGAIIGSGSFGDSGSVALSGGAKGVYGTYRLLAGPGYDPGGVTNPGYDNTTSNGNSSVAGFPLQAGVTTQGWGIGNMTYLYGGTYDSTANVNGIGAVAAGTDAGGWAENDATNQQHNVYGTGFSHFCANCHNKFLQEGGTTGDASHKHPSPGHMDTVGVNYDDYAGTGSFGTNSTPYWGLVPFEVDSNWGNTGGTAEWSASTYKNDTTSNTLKTNSAVQTVVFCLTCHRAHASAFDHDTRWDTYATFLSNSSALMSGTLISSMGSITNVIDKAYYGSTIITGGPAGVYQRSLCNKCHVQD